MELKVYFNVKSFDIHTYFIFILWKTFISNISLKKIFLSMMAACGGQMCITRYELICGQEKGLPRGQGHHCVPNPPNYPTALGEHSGKFSMGLLHMEIFLEKAF